MDTTLLHAQRELKITSGEIIDVCKTIGVDAGLKDVLHRLCATGVGSFVVLSDANEHYIDAVLAANCLDAIFKRIVSNKSVI